jgi:hypothetical protein
MVKNRLARGFELAIVAEPRKEPAAIRNQASC